MTRKLWTSDKPKQSGYYWLKDDGPKPNAEIVQVYRGRVYMMHGTSPRQRWGVKVEDIPGKWHGPIPIPSIHRANKHEAGLKDLTVTVVDMLALLDAVMDKSQDRELNVRVAKIADMLQMENDRAMHFALGMEFQEMDALKRKRERLRIKAAKRP